MTINVTKTPTKKPNIINARNVLVGRVYRCITPQKYENKTLLIVRNVCEDGEILLDGLETPAPPVYFRALLLEEPTGGDRFKVYEGLQFVEVDLDITVKEKE